MITAVIAAAVCAALYIATLFVRVKQTTKRIEELEHEVKVGDVKDEAKEVVASKSDDKLLDDFNARFRGGNKPK